MTNREVLDAQREELSPAARQRQFILRCYLTAVPCPMCRRPLNVFDGTGLTLDGFVASEGVPDRCQCPSCGVKLEHHAPLGPGVVSWEWRVNRDWLRGRLRLAEMFEQRHPEEC